MTKVVVLKSHEVKPRPDLVGLWLDESHYHTLVEEDMDIYLPPSCDDFTADENCENNLNCSNCIKGLNEKNIVFKFRKNYFSKELIEAAFEGLHEAAIETENRKNASGKNTISLENGKLNRIEYRTTQEEIDILNFFIKKNSKTIFGENLAKEEVQSIRNSYKNRETIFSGYVWLVNKLNEYKEQNAKDFNFNDFVEELIELPIDTAKEKATVVLNTFVSTTEYWNIVKSGIAGWYDRYPRIPYGRSTSYTKHNQEKFEKSYPFLQKLAQGFKELLPWRYSNQNYAASLIDPKFLIPNTPFSTITVNKNFRTSAHYDPANMEDGFANLCVISKNDNYTGCYLVFPEIGYAVNIRPGDLLLVNNQAGLHGNTPLVLNDDLAERVSIIAFFHEGMLKLGSYDYEQTRYEFIEQRRLNKDHPLQRPRWNGISPGMWADKENKENDYVDSKEWYEYLKAKGQIGEEWLEKYHPWMKKSFETNGIESFF